MKIASIHHGLRVLPSGKLEHERLTNLVNSMADGVIAVDKHMKIVVYNGAALNILDLNSSMDGKSIGSVLKPLDKNNKPVDIIEYMRDIKTPQITRDLRMQYEDQSIINLYVSIAPVNEGFGKRNHGGYVLVLRDITREKSLEEERDEFISVVSHELRTPITIAEGNISNAQLIATRTANIVEIKQTLNVAHDQILFLASMINDLATLSRAERGKLTVDIESINPHDLIQDLVSNYEPDAKRKGLYIKYQLDPLLELFQSSKLYVHEILQNFITNSLKYTEKGGVTIEAKPKDAGVLFTISDTGIGISKGDQELIFDKFFRSEDYRTRKTSGTGLGLYITMKLAHLLHAEINVQSTLNK